VAPCAEAQGDGDEGSGEVESSGIEAEKMVDKAGGLVGDALRAILDERNHPSKLIFFVERTRAELTVSSSEVLVFDNMGKVSDPTSIRHLLLSYD
jgi:hypothetical protein